MREILQDMWGGLTNVTTYKHVIVIAMFLIFLSFGYNRFMEDSEGVKEYREWLQQPYGNREFLKGIESKLQEAGYYEINKGYAGNSEKLDLNAALKKEGYYQIKEGGYKEGEQVLNLKNAIKEKSYYEIDKEIVTNIKNDDKIDVNVLKKAGYYKINDGYAENAQLSLNDALKKQNYYSIYDNGLIEKIKGFENNPQEKQKFYENVLIKELRKRADNNESPFDVLEGTLKATVPGEERDLPHTFIVHVASNSDYVDKILQLKNSETSKELILLGQNKLGTLDDASKIHLNPSQMSYLLSKKGHKADIEFTIRNDDTELKDQQCFDKIPEKKEQLCSENMAKKNMTKEELKGIIYSKRLN